MKLAFLSDVHLNFVSKAEIEALARDMCDCDVAVIAGDIAESKSLHSILNIIGFVYKKPLYYVHGNHDYYKSSIAEVKKISLAYTNMSGDNCKWLEAVGIVELTKKTCLLGCDGFYDARLGDFFNSDFELNDFRFIEEIVKCKSKKGLYSLLNKLGDESAKFILENVSKAATKYKNIIFVTHVPPFQGASLYNGNPAPKDSLPFFSNKAAGEALLDVAEKFPNNNFAVLTGHSHFSAYYKIRNISVYTADAQYYNPNIYATLEPE